MRTRCFLGDRLLDVSPICNPLSGAHLPRAARPGRLRDPTRLLSMFDQ